MKRGKLYWAWATMRHRARHSGIHVDPQWDSYEQFEKDMAPRPPHAVLRRGNSTQPFGPKTCFWGVRGRGPIELAGTKASVNEWSRRIGVPAYLIRERLDAGWSVEDALLKKVRSWGARPDDRLYAIRCSGPSIVGHKLTPWSEDLAEVYEIWKARAPAARASRYVMEIVRQSRSGVVVVLR